MSKVPQEVLNSVRSWPYEEARKIVQRVDNSVRPIEEIVLETGYGPSGLPHIGTFGEVFRTTMVRNALKTLTDLPTKLIAFSDDMDGLRKVPDNIPNQDLLNKFINQPLTSIPDPFETHESFGQHNNAMLKGFLDSFGFDYTFLSSTECYKNGLFDDVLIEVLENYENIMEIMLPTLRDERKKTYSPFLPICPSTGQVLQVPLAEINKNNTTIIYEDFLLYWIYTNFTVF